MGRSPGFGSIESDYIPSLRWLAPYSDLVSLRLRTSWYLTLPLPITRRTVLQKVRGCTHKVLPLLVNIEFQVLFHSPPGVLFTFPSQYYTLSVTEEYLGLGGGPPGFPADSSCPPVLWILTPAHLFRLRDYHPLWFGFPTNSSRNLQWIIQSSTPIILLS